MLSIKKNNHKLEFKKSLGGVILFLKFGNETKVFSLVEPGNVFLLEDGKWQLIDTSNIKHVKIYDDFMEKGAYELVKMIEKEGFSFLYDEVFLLQAIIYDMHRDKKLDWLPEGENYEFLNGEFHYDFEGKRWSYPFPSSLGIGLEEFVKGEKEKDFFHTNKVVLSKPSLPPLVKKAPLPPLVKKVLPPLGVPVKALPPVKTSVKSLPPVKAFIKELPPVKPFVKDLPPVNPPVKDLPPVNPPVKDLPPVKPSVKDLPPVKPFVKELVKSPEKIVIPLKPSSPLPSSSGPLPTLPLISSPRASREIIYKDGRDIMDITTEEE